LKQHAIAVMAIGIAAMASLAPRPALAQPSDAANETRSVRFGDTEIVLHARPQHCMLDASQAADEQLAAHFFRPRAGKMNTYLGAFVHCDELMALRSKRERVQVLSYAYYLVSTFGARDPIARPREQFLRGLCDAARGRSGSLDLGAESANRQIGAKMEALPIGAPWFGPVVAQDENGCYQIILYKRPVLGVEHREMLLTVTTEVKRLAVIYTTAMPYASAWLPKFVKLAQSDLAAFLKLNP
jgi:hypothetical protein